MLTLNLDGKDYALSPDAQNKLIQIICDKGLAEFKAKVPEAARVALEMMIVKQQAQAEIEMLKKGVPVEVIKAMRPAPGQSHIDKIAELFRPRVEKFLNATTLRLECNHDGAISDFALQSEDQGPTGGQLARRGEKR